LPGWNSTPGFISLQSLGWDKKNMCNIKMFIQNYFLQQSTNSISNFIPGDENPA